MHSEGVVPETVEVRHYADVCYVGQSYHLEVPVELKDDVMVRIKRDFYAAHDRIYGHSTEGAVRFVNLRTVHQAKAATGLRTSAFVAAEGDPRKGARRILTEKSGGFVEAQVYERRRIKPGVTFYGPAIVEQADTTTVVEPGWRAEVDSGGNLVITQGELP
jgi:N-methylhydantoinase A